MTTPTRREIPASITTHYFLLFYREAHGRPLQFRRTSTAHARGGLYCHVFTGKTAVIINKKEKTAVNMSGDKTLDLNKNNNN